MPQDMNLQECLFKIITKMVSAKAKEDNKEALDKASVKEVSVVVDRCYHNSNMDSKNFQCNHSNNSNLTSLI
jgi:hypothetical protein